MDKYQIKPGEVMVLKEDNAYDRRKSDNSMIKGELLLTTDAIVFSKKNLFGKISDVQVYPIKEIQIFNEKPQAKLESSLGVKNLVIYMSNGEILKFGIGEGLSKNGVLNWVNSIYEIITGHQYTEYDKSEYAGAGVKGMANFIGGSVDSFKKALGFGMKEPEMVVRYCQGCGQQLKGRIGDIVKCEYCDSSQKLQ